MGFEPATCLEQTIERGLKTFYEVGTALLAIRDGRLYRQGHETFETYYKERWGFQKAYAYRLIEAAQTADRVSPIGDIRPTNEAQVRPLTRLEPEQQKEAWERAVETAPEEGDGCGVRAMPLLLREGEKLFNIAPA
jgi:hypothetical protein